MYQLPSLRRTDEYVKYAQNKGISREVLERMLEQASDKKEWKWLQDVARQL